MSAPTAGEFREPDASHLTREEVLTRLDALSDSEKKKLYLAERRRLQGTDFGDGMLYQEAVCQAIFGERTCRRDKGLVVFLLEAMRSIAGHRRAALAKQVPLTTKNKLGIAHEDSIAANELSPEQTLIEKEAKDIVSQIYDLMEGDDEAQMAIIAITSGKKGKELRDELGVTQTGYDYIMRRIRKVTGKIYPKGWPHD